MSASRHRRDSRTETDGHSSCSPNDFGTFALYFLSELKSNQESCYPMVMGSTSLESHLALLGEV